MNPTSARLRTTLTRSTAAAVLGSALLLSGCSAGSDSSTAGGASAASDQRAAEVPAQDKADGTSVEGSAPSGAQGAADVSPILASQMLARTAALSLDVKDLEAAAGQVRAIATTAGGLIVSEKLASYDVDGSGREDSRAGLAGTITLQVPGTRLDAVLADLAKVGTVRNRSVSSEDVKGQVVDTESRLQTMRESVARVRALMGQATKLSDVVALESELSRRQADLESLEGQLASLKDSVALSPITVSLQRTGATTPTEEESDNAFLVGLRNGWDAFAGAVAVILTILGALLPFAILAGLVGWPLLTWWRRRRAQAQAAPAPGAAAAPAAEPTEEPEPAGAGAGGTTA